MSVPSRLPDPRGSSGPALTAPVALILAALWLAAGQVVLPAALQPPLTLPIALLAPGYGLVVAAFGRALRLPALGCLCLCAVLSLAVYALIAVGLSAADVRLSKLSVTAVVLVVLATLAAVAQLRRAPDIPPLQLAATDRRTLLGATVAVGVATAAVTATLLLVPKPVPTPFMDVYLGGRLSGLDRVLAVDPSRRLNIPLTIENHTHKPAVYHVQGRPAGASAWTPRDVRLAAGAVWRGVLGGSVRVNGCASALRIVVTSPGSPSARRSIIVWMTSSLAARCP